MTSIPDTYGSIRISNRIMEFIRQLIQFFRLYVTEDRISIYFKSNFFE
eukprot:UN27039